jgi:hypothetical protein
VTIKRAVPEYIAALTEVKCELMQFRRFAGHLPGSDLLRRLSALTIEIGRLALEISQREGP